MRTPVIVGSLIAVAAAAAVAALVVFNSSTPTPLPPLSPPSAQGNDNDDGDGSPVGGVPGTKCGLTENNILGPYYKAGAPAWQVPDDLPGERLVISGRVMDRNCDPVPAAVLDFWQADSEGRYDNSGYTLRGTVTANENGEYVLDTVYPGKYETRPAHIHVKVWSDGQDVLTTQLYFIEGDRDSFVKDSLILEADEGQDGTRRASFDFVVLNNSNNR